MIIESVRTPIGRRGGGFANAHSLDVLGSIQRALFERSGVDPSEVGQVIGGCVGQVGIQAMNVTRNAWLAAGLPTSVPATTVDSQCGSAQQAVNLAYGLVAGGVVDVAVGCGVELMTRVPLGSSIPQVPNVGKAINKTYWAQHKFTTQFEAAERMADRWGFSRADADAMGKQSQDRAAAAIRERRFERDIVPVNVPARNDDGTKSDESATLTVDECPRETTLEGLATLKPTGRPDGIHTAGTTSQIADGAAAVLMMTREKANVLGLRPRAQVVDVCLVGCDPVLMLEGPIPATRTLLSNSTLTIKEIDVVEVNEAFASVVLAFEAEFDSGMEKVNPNGGAIALGHPLGATGAILIGKALSELERTDSEHAIVTMCCGGGLGTGTLLRRL